MLKNRDTKQTPVSKSAHWIHGRRLLAVVALACFGSIAWACGPNFYAWLITRGKSAMLYAPFANFSREIQPAVAGRNVKERHRDTGSLSEPPALALASAELAEALKSAGIARAKRDRIVADYTATRAAMREQSATLEAWRQRRQWDKERAGPKPVFEAIAEPAGLPREFQLYLRGAVAYHRGELPAAKATWRELLRLPEAQRPYRSTWAAYMLGRIAMNKEPEAARKFFAMTRELASRGFRDSQGLAAASLGWQAKLALESGDYADAIRLYLDHYATGETNTSLQSLRITASAACRAGVETLRPLARRPESRQIITAYLLSRAPQTFSHNPDSPDRRALNWLEAVEKENAAGVEMAERLALAAYQAGEPMMSDRWLRRARPDTLLTQWLRAKLLLWDGQTDAAARVYDRILARHADALTDPIRYRSGEWFDTLRTRFDSFEVNPASRSLAAEAGLVRLHRHEFIGALDVLARAGFWMDAAYLGERILTLDELKLYVDENWPPSPDAGPDAKPYWQNTAWGPRATPKGVGLHLRHLLARRLARARRYDEAERYLPGEYRAEFNLFVKALRTGFSDSLPKARRKESLVRAARLLRHRGMEFIGTEMAPDGAWANGDFGDGITFTNRAHLKAGEFLAPDDAEAERYSRHSPRPDKQYHYRYLAADLAWEASLLMDNNTLELARWFCEAGGWLKNRDPKAADRFYKALVRRCRKTDIGAAADQRRWFPKLDKDGNLILPAKPKLE